MLKRDSLAAQMQQLSYTLAKAKRLVLDGEITQSEATLKEALTGYFGTSITELLETPNHLFVKHLKDESFKVEELGLLADFLDELATTQENKQTKNNLLGKVLVIYDLLEQDHKMVSFAHLARRAEIGDLSH